MPATPAAHRPGRGRPHAVPARDPTKGADTLSEAANRRVYDPIEKLREDAAHLRNEAASLLEMIPGYYAYIEGHQKQAREYETAADQLDDAALALEKLASRDHEPVASLSDGAGAGEPADKGWPDPPAEPLGAEIAATESEDELATSGYVQVVQAVE